jgi:hypothetical protein
MNFRFFPRDDIFISYPRQGASTYASGLADELLKRGLSPFVDKFDTRASPILTDELRKKIRECKMFVVIGTSRAGSRPIIEEEIKEYLTTGRHTIVPIDFNNAIPKARWYSLIEGIPLEPEPRVLSLKDGNPSASVINRIEKQFTYKRSKQSQRRTTMTLASLSLIFVAVSVVAFLFATRQIALATQARAEASQFHADALQAQRDRDSAQTERDKANVDRQTAETQATQAKEEAARNQTIAADAKARAGAAMRLQKEAEAQTRVAVGEGMIAAGYQAVNSVPSDAVNMAFAAKPLLGSDRNSDLLLSDALRSNPIWFQHSPEDSDPNNVPLSLPESSPTDPIATDKGITRLLSPAKRYETQGIDLILREIPSGRILSKLSLSQNEELITPAPLGTQLFVTHSKDKTSGTFSFLISRWT